MIDGPRLDLMKPDTIFQHTARRSMRSSASRRSTRRSPDATCEAPLATSYRVFDNLDNFKDKAPRDRLVSPDALSQALNAARRTF
ncbi:MAG: hypothetical protein QNJ35_01290 [Paracoccaceae bacterium]|nr:hypothetical protein [Paracoccaceae bacterium]